MSYRMMKTGIRLTLAWALMLGTMVALFTTRVSQASESGQMYAYATVQVSKGTELVGIPRILTAVSSPAMITLEGEADDGSPKLGVELNVDPVPGADGQYHATLTYEVNDQRVGESTLDVQAEREQTVVLDAGGLRFAALVRISSKKE